jgi:hypothetical protein
MAQAKSGFSTEGTQYTTDKAYYLLDTVPGSGSVIDGPVTITGNLTTTGNETIQGALGVAGNITAPGVFQVAGAAAPLNLIGSSTTTGGITVGHNVGSAGTTNINGAGSNALILKPNGDADLLVPIADTIRIANQVAPGFNGLVVAPTGVSMDSGPGATRATVAAGGTLGVLVDSSFGPITLRVNPTALLQALSLENTQGPINITGGTNPGTGITIGCPLSFNGVFLSSGLQCAGSASAPIVIPGPAAVYTMTTNKAFLQTTAITLAVSYPPNIFGGPPNGQCIITPVFGTSYAPQGGSGVGSGNLVQFVFTPGSTNTFCITVI